MYPDDVHFECGNTKGPDRRSMESEVGVTAAVKAPWGTGGNYE